MAGIDTGSGHGGGRAVNQEIPLVPFIDFLLCCVMFLLVTAVWNQLSRIESSAGVASGETTASIDPPAVRRLLITNTGYVLSVGDAPTESIARLGDRYDIARLASRLAVLQQVEPSRHDLVVEATDDVKFVDIVDAMDVTVGAGFSDTAISPVQSTQPR